MLIIPIDINCKVIDTKYICVCPNCQHERTISYKQQYNIKNGINSDKCRQCRLELGEVKLNLSGLKIGRNKENQEKSKKGRTGIKRPTNTKRLIYEHLFYPEKMLSIEIKEKQRNAKLGILGKNHHNWKGGKTSENHRLRNSDQVKQLRKFIFERDNFICQICNKRGGELNMDHIKEWCNYPGLRFDPTNCRTLCRKCHLKTENFGTKAIKNKVL